MLEITRENDKAIISVTTDLVNNCEGTKVAAIPFSWSLGQPYLADLLVRHIKNILRNKIISIKAEHYNQGWKDARARREKETHFTGEL